MIINCTYITNADNGIFESEAKLNTETGNVFEILPSKDKNEEYIESVKSEEISFILEETKYVFAVTFTDSDYIIESSQDLKMLTTLNFDNYLKEQLSEKSETKSKLKI